MQQYVWKFAYSLIYLFLHLVCEVGKLRVFAKLCMGVCGPHAPIEQHAI
jgi:hypothetical protein